MYRAAIQRALHDACGAVVVARTMVEQKQIAIQAWNFLYSQQQPFVDDRTLVCGLADLDVDFLARRMKVAAVPRPTDETLRRAWTELELAYWRLNGEQGERPEPRPENSRGLTGHASATNELRMAKGYRVGPTTSTRRLSAGNGDRRDAGQPRVERDTLLFGRRRGTPVRAKFGLWGSSLPGAQLNLPFAA